MSEHQSEKGPGYEIKMALNQVEQQVVPKCYVYIPGCQKRQGKTPHSWVVE